jgi:outer membrane lipoprotein-sorting protein
VFCGHPYGVQAGNEEPDDPHVILDRMALAYRECRSYRDTGLVTTTFTSQDRHWTEETEFHTAFVRPDRFRFEMSDRGKRYIIWRRGAEVRTWWDLEGKHSREESLDAAIAGATGVSRRSAHTIPALLMSDLSGTTVTDLAEPVRLPDGVTQAADCFRIRGRISDNAETIWIDKGSHLIRRIEEERPSGTRRDTTYNPAIDDVISDEFLSFGAPADRWLPGRVSWFIRGGFIVLLLGMTAWWLRGGRKSVTGASEQPN